MQAVLKNAIAHWSHIAPLVSVPTNEAEYDTAIEHLETLLDVVGEDEKHPLVGLVDLLGHLIERYEDQHFTPQQVTGVEALRELILSNALRQSDLPEIGSQGVVSEILSGSRELNLRQAKALAKRFNLSIDTFVDD